MAHPYDPNFRLGIGVGSTEHDDHEHDSSASAANVAVNLISSVRTLLRLDTVFTEYSAQYLLDKAGANRYLTVKDCLTFALKEGIPKAEDWPVWPHKPSTSNNSPPALVSMKGQVLEAKQVEEAGDLLAHLPVAAKLHVFSPQIDLVGDGIYCGSSGEAFSYVGLRDVIIVRVEKIQGKSIAIVKLWYKNKMKFVKVAISRWFLFAPIGGCSVALERTGLLVDIVAPRLSID